MMKPADQPLAGECEVGVGRGELPVCHLTHPSGSTVQVSLYGAHVVSWTCEGKERLFLSETSEFQVGKAIRGGIPVCWPQFANLGSMPKHGVARTNEHWQIANMGKVENSDDLEIALAMAHGEVTLTVKTILRARSLEQIVVVDNDTEVDFSFTSALHTYFKTDLPVIVRGLEECAYLDKVKGNQLCNATHESVSIDGREIDRCYFNTDDVRFGDLVVEKKGFPDTVVWNIGTDRAPSLKDLSSTNYVCVETAYVQAPCVVEPGQSWIGSQKISLA